MFRLSTYASLISPDPREAIATCARLGLDAVVLDARFGELNLLEISGSGMREFRHIVASNRLALAALRVELSRSALLGSDPQQSIDRLRRSLEVARLLESPLVLTDLQRLPNPRSPDAPRPRATPELAGGLILPDAAEIAAISQSAANPPGDEREIAWVDQALSRVAEYADRIGVNIALSASLSSMSALHRALVAAGSQHFRVDLDPVAVLADAWSFEQAFDHLGPMIAHVRLRDAQLGSSQKTIAAAVGDGSVNVSRLTSLLQEAGYAGVCSIDVSEAADRFRALSAAVRRLRAEQA